QRGGDADDDDGQPGDYVVADGFDAQREAEDDNAQAQHRLDAQPQALLVRLGDADGIADNQAKDDGEGNRADRAFARFELQSLTDQFGELISSPRERQGEADARRDAAEPIERIVRPATGGSLLLRT